MTKDNKWGLVYILIALTDATAVRIIDGTIFSLGIILPLIVFVYGLIQFMKEAEPPLGKIEVMSWNGNSRMIFFQTDPRTAMRLKKYGLIMAWRDDPEVVRWSLDVKPNLNFDKILQELMNAKHNHQVF